jgi:hypothetical protein
VQVAKSTRHAPIVAATDAFDSEPAQAASGVVAHKKEFWFCASLADEAAQRATR